MNEQRTPDELIAESELICEKLLGWSKRTPGFATPGIEFYGWRLPDGSERPTPSFTTWADAGLILEALKMRLPGLTLEFRGYANGDCEIVNPGTELMYGYAKTWPLAIRAAALDYIKAMKS
jgi:hypothetical protein